MYKVFKCVACDSNNVEYKETGLAKFIQFRIFGNNTDNGMPIVGMKCLDCSFVGSADRFTDDETKIYYNGYRDNEYTRTRIMFEPGYTDIEKFNSIAYKTHRQEGIQKLIKQYIDVDQIHTVLDYGGDNGSVIPDWFDKSKKYVFDISNVPLTSKVESISLNENKIFDFILCTHLLEHVSDPNDTLGKIKEHANDNTWIYFEIPNNPAPYIGIIHEHINFFNIKSATALLNRNGFKVIDVCEYGFDSFAVAHKNNLCILAKLY
jgi:hypothetical protein